MTRVNRLTNQNAKRVLLIRLSSIGDVAMASGLIPALRGAWPDAHLAWLVEPASQDLLRHNPRLDEVIVWPKQEWKRLWRERRYRELGRRYRRFRGELRARRFDLVLDAQGILKSGLWARLARAPERIGLDSREGSRLLMTRVIQTPNDDPRLGSEYRELARALGFAEQDFVMDVAVAAADSAAVQTQLKTLGIENNRYAVSVRSPPGRKNTGSRRAGVNCPPACASSSGCRW